MVITTKRRPKGSYPPPSTSIIFIKRRNVRGCGLIFSRWTRAAVPSWRWHFIESGDYRFNYDPVILRDASNDQESSRPRKKSNLASALQISSNSLTKHAENRIISACSSFYSINKKCTSKTHIAFYNYRAFIITNKCEHSHICLSLILTKHPLEMISTSMRFDFSLSTEVEIVSE